MNYIVTLVSSDKLLNQSLITETAAALGQRCNTIEWLSPGKAAAIEIDQHAAITPPLRDFLNHHKIDIFITPAENRRKKLLLADMDATIVTGETLDDLAAFAGLKEQIAAITTRAMEGKLDFESALRERVALLKGLNANALQQTLDHMTLSPGGKILIHTMKKHGCTCVLVSGGFTFFTGAIADMCGFDHHHGNTLIIENDNLTGTVDAPILDKNAKAAFLEQYRADLSLSPADTMAIGDGANDIPMLQSAGLGIGYQPKQPVRDRIANLIFHNDLTAALYAQGYGDEDFAAD